MNEIRKFNANIQRGIDKFDEAIQEFRSKGNEFLELGNHYLELGNDFHRLGVEYHQFGVEVLGNVKFGFKLGSSTLLAFAAGGVLFYSGRFIHELLSAPSPLEADSMKEYQKMVECFLKKKDLSGALNTLFVMVESDIIPTKTIFESVVRSTLDEHRVQILNKLLKMITELEVSLNSDLVTDCLACLFMKGKSATALKRMADMNELNVNRLLDGLIQAKKKPSTISAVRLLTYLVSKKEALAAVRLVDSHLFSGCVRDSHLSELLETLEDILSANEYKIELLIVKNFREHSLDSIEDYNWEECKEFLENDSIG